MRATKTSRITENPLIFILTLHACAGGVYFCHLNRGLQKCRGFEVMLQKGQPSGLPRQVDRESMPTMYA